MSRARVGIGGGVRVRIGRGLRFRAVYAKLSRVPLNWEVKHPNETIGNPKRFPRPASGLVFPALCFTRFRGVDFCKWK